MRRRDARAHRPRPTRSSAGRRASRAIGLGLSLLSAGCAPNEGLREAVLLDGLFDEWSEALTIVEDPMDAPESAIDLGSVLGLDAPGWLYLSVYLGNEVNVQSLPGTLEVLFDADADISTGGAVHSMDGVDLVLEISQTEAPLVPGRGAGFALRRIEEGGTRGPIVRYALGVTIAPSWAASRIELRISRRGAGGLPALGPELRLKAAYVSGERVDDETEIGEYRFVTAARRPALASSSGRLTKPAGSIRVAQWNVASESFARNAVGFARVLAAIEPDVILLDEAPGGVTQDAVGAFFALEPFSGGTWSFVLGASGGRQRTVVAARDRAIRPAQSMQVVPYSEGALETLAETTPRSFGRLLELEARRGISSTGAWVDVADRQVLFVPVDLQSQGWAGSPHDQLRMLQARTVNERIQAELDGRSAPVVIGGDLNLVGSRGPLLALIAGLDTNGSDLMPVDAERLGERTYATWRNPGGLFAPGRLDFLLVPSAALSVLNSFVFTTEDLDPETLARLGLERDLSVSISDHLVVVADLQLRP